MNKRLILVLFGLLSLTEAIGQNNAINENKVTLAFSDEFNYSGTNYCNYLNRAYGTTVPYLWFFQRFAENSLGGQDNVSFKGDCSFLYMNGNDLVIKTVKGPFTETWSPSGNTYTRDYGGNFVLAHPALRNEVDMTYGIYEFKFKIPDAITTNSSGNTVYRNNGITFGAWLYGVKSDVCHSEIDFFEMSGKNNQFTHNFLYGGADPNDCVPVPGGGQLPSHEGLNKLNFNDINTTFNCSPERYAGFYRKGDPTYPDDASGYTTMTVEVSPQKITWFMNGKTIQSTTGDDYHTDALQNLPPMDFGFAVSAGDGHDPNLNGSPTTFPDATTIFPFEAQIDYFRYFKFRCDDQTARDESSGIRYPNTQMSDFVYKYIKIGDDGFGGPRITNGENITLRAVEYIELLPGFEVSLEAEFYADVHECDK